MKRRSCDKSDNNGQLLRELHGPGLVARSGLRGPGPADGAQLMSVERPAVAPIEVHVMRLLSAWSRCILATHSSSYDGRGGLTIGRFLRR